jgi:hypothetical protein
LAAGDQYPLDVHFILGDDYKRSTLLWKMGKLPEELGLVEQLG